MTLTGLAASIFGTDEASLDDDSAARNTPNWDSARHIDLLLAVEVAFGVQFSMAQITRMHSLGDIRAVLDAQAGAAAAA